MGLRDLLGGFGRQKGSEALKERAKREFARGDNAAGVAALIEIGEDGEPEVLFQVGECYETATGVMLNFATAAGWFERAAQKNHLPSQIKLGDYYLFGRRAHDAEEVGAAEDAETGASRLRPKGVSVPADFAKALDWNTRAAEAGAAEAQARLGYQYAAGLGVAPDYDQAKNWFSASAEQGSSSGQFGLGMLYAGNYFGAPDFKAAAEWFEKAAGQGDVASKYYLALLLKEDLGADSDAERAAALFTEAAEAEHTDAMFQLGLIYRDGVGLQADAILAETWLRRAASRGQVGAMLELARFLVQNPGSPDYGSAAVLLREAADLGDSLAQFYLGQLYNGGLGVPHDPATAAFWFRKAADAGVVGAVEALGLMHVDGTGLEQDYGAAFSLLKKAADEGSPSAEFGIANLYNSGLGLERNPKAAAESYRRAAERGNAEACLRLGTLYAAGDGVEQDFAAAVEWYVKAADAGNSDAVSNLAFLYIRGLGVPQDEARGVDMLRKLADDGKISAVWSLYNLYSTGLYLPADPAEAGTWLECAAKMGSGTAACEFARQIEEGRPNAPTVDQAVAWLVSAAENKNAAAQETLGRWLYEGKFVPRDQEAAFRWLSSAAELGNPAAQAWMGDVLNAGLAGVVLDRDVARMWYERAAKQQHVGALSVLSEMVLADEPSADRRAMILDLWQVLADAGDPYAQVRLAEFHMGADGFPASPGLAETWLRAAAAQEDTGAQVRLAKLLLQSETSEEEFREAVGMLQRAAAKGDIDGEYNLGICYQYGIAAPLDLDVAERLYRGAAIRGHSPAQLSLANLLVERETEASFREAANWFEQAAAADMPEAYLGLGRLLEGGKGVAPNPDKAAMLYRKALDLGSEDAREALDHLENALSGAG